MNRDAIQKIAENSDDKTALSILTSDEKMDKDTYYQAVFGKRYPDLIKYKKDGESLKHLYLRMLETIGLLKEEFNIIYKEGNPDQILLNGNTINKVLINGSSLGSLKLVKWALRNGADINYIPHNGNSALVKASYEGNLEIVKYLVENGANIHSEDDAALKFASKLGHYEVVKYLVENGANIHAQGNKALRWAIKEERVNIVKYLFEKIYQNVP